MQYLDLLIYSFSDNLGQRRPRGYEASHRRLGTQSIQGCHCQSSES